MLRRTDLTTELPSRQRHGPRHRDGAQHPWCLGYNHRPSRALVEPSHRQWAGTNMGPSEFAHLVEVELRDALSVRRDPFTELGPQSRRGLPLAENALVSHWAVRRYGQLQDAAEEVAKQCNTLHGSASRQNPDGRWEGIENEIKRLAALEHKLSDLQGHLTRLTDDVELMTAVYPSPLFQRDYRLRHLLRAFAPPILGRLV